MGDLEKESLNKLTSLFENAFGITKNPSLQIS